MKLFLQLCLLATAAFFVLLWFIAILMSNKEDAQTWMQAAIGFGILAIALEQL